MYLRLGVQQTTYSPFRALGPPGTRKWRPEGARKWRPEGTRQLPEQPDVQVADVDPSGRRTLTAPDRKHQKPSGTWETSSEPKPEDPKGPRA